MIFIQKFVEPFGGFVNRDFLFKEKHSDSSIGFIKRLKEQENSWKQETQLEE